MNTIIVRRQRGATLLIALVTLLVITVLAVGSMRGVTLESRISANRAAASQQQALADAALREGEYRFFGPAFLRQKLEPHIENCTKENTLKASGNNKPCLINEMTEEQLKVFFKEPLSFLRDNSFAAVYSARTGAEADSASGSAKTAWMPYRGLDAVNLFEGGNAYWNSFRVLEGAQENESINPEYGAALEGKGTYFFMINGQTNDAIATQSTLSVIYLGLNF